MRALLDYHHADLAESLHLLLEDRLGIECYIPVGLGWWERGFWNFGRSTWGDDRLGRQFLTRENVEVDDAHPERRHRVIEVADALEIGWDYVVASVPDNYAGYHDFAQRSNARFVIQVGNVNQPVAWNLDPLVLNSSEQRVEGRGITYHQEFDLTAFHYAPVDPDLADTVGSFVNCMDRMPCYPVLADAMVRMPERSFGIFGIDGMHGNIKPTAKVAEVMRRHGWAWHDKITGDGFGHVIHNWAAVGRPLIGHAGHYTGQMAAPLWEDGVTCIDLDRHAIADVPSLMAEYDQTAMGQAIRQRFDELVDYDAEAEKIGALLA